ncbi:MAG: hypothetical protein WAT92_00180 [Saprospiraceae bacterium]
MTAKEKAESLVLKFQIFLNYDQVSNLVFHDPSPKNSDYHERVKRDAKKLSLIAIEEIIKESSKTITTVRYKGCNLTDNEYWNEVKKEIEKL